MGAVPTKTEIPCCSSVVERLGESHFQSRHLFPVYTMTAHREYVNNAVVKPKKDLFKCRGCNAIYRSAAQNPKCPRDNPRCVGTIQRATARNVG